MSTSIITRKLLTTIIKQFYHSVTAQNPVTGNPVNNMYCFLGDPGIHPSYYTNLDISEFAAKNIMKHMFVAKKLTSGNFSPIIKRVDWVFGYYNSYSDKVNYKYYQLSYPVIQNSDIWFDNVNVVRDFYIKNRYDQVFICLNNNTQRIPDGYGGYYYGAGYSYDEPYFDPGNYNANKIFTGSDGYKWKYLYTIDPLSKLKFMDDSYMPVPISPFFPYPTDLYGGGSVEAINVYFSNTGFNADPTLTTVNIKGDGTGAEASAVITGDSVTDIIINSPGKNYTKANVSVTSLDVTGNLIFANCDVVLSPIGGLGLDLLNDLQCQSIMVVCEFDGAERSINGVDMIPTDISYGRTGLLVNPTSVSTYPNPATESIYNLATQLVILGGTGSYSSGEIVYQGDINNPEYSATVVSFDKLNNILSVINTTGTLTINKSIIGATSATARTVISSNDPDFIPLSGYLAYLTQPYYNIRRSPDGIDQLKFIIDFTQNSF